ncbi:unnamed protein product, partial [Didymodactylos carnosus]
DGFNLKSTILDFSTFDKRHTSHEISRILTTKLKELNILHKVIRVTCDGASNMVRAVGDLNLESGRLWCVAHRLHLTVTNASGFWIKKSGDENICIDEAENVTDSTDDHEEEMLDCDSLQPLDRMEINVKSRWNSTFCMIDSFLVLREVIERLLNSKHHLPLKSKAITKLAELKLTSDDWAILSQLHFVLQPFFHATKVMSGRPYPSIGFAFDVLMRLKGVLQDHPPQKNSIVKRLKQLLLTKLLFYFESDNEQLYLLKVSGL